MKFTFKTTTQSKFGQTNVLPVAGQVTFSNTGECDIDFEDAGDAIQLLQAVPDLRFKADNGTLLSLQDLQELLKDEPAADTKESDLTKANEENTNTDNTIAPQTNEGSDLGKSETGNEIKGELVTNEPLAGTGTGLQAAAAVSETATPVVNTEVLSEKIEAGAELNEAELQVEKDNLIASLDKKDVPGLQDLCRLGEYPQTEWVELDKEGLIAYITAKLNGK